MPLDQVPGTHDDALAGHFHARLGRLRFLTAVLLIALGLGILAAPLAAEAQQPAKVYRNTAKALKITFPQTILIRADHVIQ